MTDFLWQEFERRETAEARFAHALDRLMPILHNSFTNGRSWNEHGIIREQALATNIPINDGSSAIWKIAEALIRDGLSPGITPGAPSTLGTPGTETRER